ncbi:hypothetical protein Y1Q_0008581 [Alligator mississippiensis]|uniref:Uncharacterized protein n=1 Tax=Alligator mississippiensis TaxID=8496 RepID=A0A151MSF2_ALLMI|nr:hypothetical protein Y1Q_0008581 [Alligator mississippiensis]
MEEQPERGDCELGSLSIKDMVSLCLPGSSVEDSVQSEYPVADIDSRELQLLDTTSSNLARWKEPILTLEDFPYISRYILMELDNVHRIIVCFQQQDKEKNLPQDVAQQGTEEKPERDDWELVSLTSEDMVSEQYKETC